MQLGVPVARIELLDELQIDAVNRLLPSELSVEADAVFRVSRHEPGGVAEHAQHGAGDRRGKRRRPGSSGRRRLKIEPGSGRRATTRSTRRSRSARVARRGRPTSACRSRSLAECVLETRRDVQRSTLVAPLMGHVGDGNFHLVFVLDPDEPQELAEASEINARLVRRAQAMGGTCTGEHGVGIGKMDYLPHEHGAALDVMKTIKRALDPDNLMNPGKMFATRESRSHRDTETQSILFSLCLCDTVALYSRYQMAKAPIISFTVRSR